MHFPLRLYGIENEFAVVAQTSEGTFIDTLDNRISHMIEAMPIENSVLVKESIRGAERVWHTNGSCTYVDIGDHPEHATAECLSVRDVVKYNKAGEILASRVFDHVYPNPLEANGRRLAGLSHHMKFLLFKNNLGYDIYADESTISGQFGCHENYLLYTNSFLITPLTTHDYDQKIQILLKPLIPFLATRQIFDGSGWWEKNTSYHLSQRASAIQTEIGGGAVSTRSFFQIKTGDTGSDTRLHIVSGDANICEFALYLKLGTMSLVLALLESGCCPVLNCKNTPAALKEISRYGDSCIYPFQTQDGTPLSVLNVQSIFFESVRAQLPSATYANDEIKAEVAQTMLYWEQTLNAFYNCDDEWMRGRIDHVTKRYITETHIRKQKINNPSELLLVRKTIDIMYHCVSNPTLQQKIKNKWHDRRIVDDNEIHHATLHAPQNTRARMRGMFVQALLDKGRRVSDGMGWNQLSVNYKGRRDFLNLPHGLVANSDEFEKFLLLVKKMK